MTQQPEPVTTIEALYRLFMEGRVDETFAIMDPAVVLVEPGDPDLLPWAGRFEGHEGVRRFYDGLGSGLSSIAIDPDHLEVTALDDERVLATGIERGVSAATGLVYETASAWIWTVRAGRIVHLQAYHDTAAMEAAMSGAA